MVETKQPTGLDRPIQISESLDRRVSSVLFMKHKPGFVALAKYSSGSTRLARWWIWWRRSLTYTSSFVLNADRYNGFNETFCTAMDVPNALPYFRLKYEDSSRVHFGDFPMTYEECVRQDCPWARVFSWRTRQPVVEAMYTRNSDCCVVRVVFDNLSIVFLVVGVRRGDDSDSRVSWALPRSLIVVYAKTDARLCQTS